MSILKIEAFSGLSGDMFLSAFAALTDGYEEIKALPEKLGIQQEVEIRLQDMNKMGIVCRHIKIIDKNKQKEPAHHQHRHLSHIHQIIDQANLTPGTKEIARKIFHLLGEAESKVHGVPIEKIHFHEVGAIDSILDIVGTALLIDKLGISKTYCTAVNTGSGFANTEHGRLPVPTPATQYLLMGFPTQPGEVESEMTTPTGAAILRFLNPEFQIPVLVDENIAYGPGEKDFKIPNVLRLSLCKTSYQQGSITMVQTNIDDMSGEFLGVEFQNKLFELGALDLYFEQVIMKRGRPGVVLNILVKKENLHRISEYIFQQTTTIGIRYFDVQRLKLEREIREIDTAFGKVKWKETNLPGNNRKRGKPESRDVFTIAERENKSSLDIFNQIIKHYENESD